MRVHVPEVIVLETLAQVPVGVLRMVGQRSDLHKPWSDGVRRSPNRFRAPIGKNLHGDIVNRHLESWSNAAS